MVAMTTLKVVRDVHCARQHLFIISESGQVLQNGRQMEFVSRDDVRCRLLQSDSTITSHESLVFHIHGGGFVSQSPDSHELYLRDWATKLNGIPILSVDYSLSPKHKYPKQLQQLLDSFLFIIDKSEEILGFKVKKVVICGDSAGGNLAIALTLVLDRIRKQTEVENIPLIPKGVVCFYTP